MYSTETPSLSRRKTNKTEGSLVVEAKGTKPRRVYSGLRRAKEKAQPNSKWKDPCLKETETFLHCLFINKLCTFSFL